MIKTPALLLIYLKMRKIITTLYGVKKEIVEKETPKLNQMCVIIWLQATGQYEWYIGYITAEHNKGFLADHLHRKLHTIDGHTL